MELVIGIVSDYLKMEKHMHTLSLSGVDVTPLSLNLYKRVFALMGFESDEVPANLKDWYFQQVEKAYSLDIFNDERALYELSSGILLEFQNAKYDNNNRGNIAV